MNLQCTRCWRRDRIYASAEFIAGGESLCQAHFEEEQALLDQLLNRAEKAS